MANRSAVAGGAHASRGEIIKLLRQEIRDISEGRGRRSNLATVKQLARADECLKELWERQSGPATEGDGYSFARGSEASFLKAFAERRSEGDLSITVSEVNRLFKIYGEYFPQMRSKTR